MGSYLSQYDYKMPYMRRLYYNIVKNSLYMLNYHQYKC